VVIVEYRVFVVLLDVFVGQLKSALTCLTCGYVSNTFDPFLDLSLPIPKVMTTYCSQLTHAYGYFSVFCAVFVNISHRNWSHIAARFVVERSCWRDSSYTVLISNQIWVKFDRSVLQVNMHRLTESDFRFDSTLSRWWPWRHFTQKSAATWLSEHEASAYCVRTSWRSFLIHSIIY